MRRRGGKGSTITGFLMSAKQGFFYPAASSQFFFFFFQRCCSIFQTGNQTIAQGASEVMKNRASLGVFSMVMGLFWA